MMRTNNENYVNDVNGSTFANGTLSTHRNSYGVRVLSRGARSKNKRQSPPAALVAAPPMCPLHIWREEWRLCRVLVLEIMSHTHGSTITNCCWAIGISSPLQEKSWNYMRKQSSFISILSEFLQPKDVVLELWSGWRIETLLFWC